MDRAAGSRFLHFFLGEKLFGFSSVKNFRFFIGEKLFGFSSVKDPLIFFIGEKLPVSFL